MGKQKGATVPTLREILLDPARRPDVVAALVGAVGAEVESRSGLSGAAVKAGYKAVQKLSPDLVRRAVNSMLPQWAEHLEPFWSGRGDQSFAAHLVANGSAAADALLAVTDARAANPKHAAIAKVYSKLRGKAKDNVEAALPRLGEALQSLAG